MDTAAHMLITADGSLYVSDKYGRDMSRNPQIRAGDNANAIGVYIEQYTPATQSTLEHLRGQLEQRVRSDGQNYSVTVMGAGTPEMLASQPAPQLGPDAQPIEPALPQRPRVSSLGGL